MYKTWLNSRLAISNFANSHLCRNFSWKFHPSLRSDEDIAGLLEVLFYCSLFRIVIHDSNIHAYIKRITRKSFFIPGRRVYFIRQFLSLIHTRFIFRSFYTMKRRRKFLYLFVFSRSMSHQFFCALIDERFLHFVDFQVIKKKKRDTQWNLLQLLKISSV